MVNPKTNRTRRALATFAPVALIGMLLLSAAAPSASAATLVNVEISAPRQRANAVETWWIQFTTVTAVPAGGDIKVTFPAGFTTSFGGTTQCEIHQPNDIVTENTTVMDSRTIVCGLGTANISANKVVRLSVSSMRNPSDAGTTGSFQLQTRTERDGLIDQHTSNAESILPEQIDGLTKVDVRAPLQQTGALEQWTFQFSPTKAVPQGGSVRILFPLGFILSQDPPSQCNWDTAGISGANSSLMGVREIGCNLTAADRIESGGTIRLNVTGVRNPSTEQYTGTFLIQTRDGETLLDESTQDQELIRAHEFLAGPVHRTNSTDPGDVAFHRFEFMLFNGWAPDGMLEITLPFGYTYASSGSDAPNVTFEQGGQGAFAPALLEGRTLVFKRLGGTTLFNGAHLLLRLDNVTNPSESAVTDTFTLATMNASRLTHDRGMISGQLITSTSPTPTTTATTPTTATTSTTSTTPTNETTPTTNSTPTSESPIGPLDDDTGVSASPRGQGSPGLEAVPVLGALVAATLLVLRRRRE